MGDSLPAVSLGTGLTAKAVFTQTLIPHVSGTGRALACETLMVTAGLENLIREGKVEQIPMLMQTGGKFGMQTMNQCLADLVAKRKIAQKEAIERSSDPDELQKLIAQRSSAQSKSRMAV